MHEKNISNRNLPLPLLQYFLHTRMTVELVPHLNFLKPRPTSFEHTTPWFPVAEAASMRPTSRPTTYPAEKLIALNRTTTPALTTQVINVGEMFKSSILAFCFFRASRRLREVDAFRLPFSLLEAPLDPLAERLRALGRGGSGVSPMTTDSGTIRKVLGSTLFAGAAAGRGGSTGACSRLGRPRAAAAHERRVERLARRAASWSAWWDGEMTLYGVCERLLCVG